MYEFRDNTSKITLKNVETALIVVFTVAVASVAVYFDGFELFEEFVADHEPGSWTSSFVVLMFGGIASFFLLFRRAGDLRLEISRREASEWRPPCSPGTTR